MIPQTVPKIIIDFTDERLTGNAGLVFIGQLAKQLRLPELLSDTIKVKQRRRGCSDSEMLLSLIYSLCTGHGCLPDVDALNADSVSQQMLGLTQVPDSRRLGEYLSRCTPEVVDRLQTIIRTFTPLIIPDLITHHREQDGYIPVFMDGSAIEVTGRLFEHASWGFSGEDQYWLHGVFIGGMWASGRLHPGGSVVTKGWRCQLDQDVCPLFKGTDRIWLRADNSYYKGKLVDYCRAKGWDYSISVTDGRKKKPIVEQLEGLSDDCWTDIGLGEQAIFAYYQPTGWSDEQIYVMIRRLEENQQQLLMPIYTVILVSRGDLPVAELIKRHRGKQGQENAFKGPLIDLDLHHPPCRSFIANQVVYACGQIAQLLLRAAQFQLLPTTARQHGIRPIIRYLIRSCARLVQTGRRLKLYFAKTAFRLDWIYYASCQLE